jgi:Ca2+-binding EF-hand superfamily protein
MKRFLPIAGVFIIACIANLRADDAAKPDVKPDAAKQAELQKRLLEKFDANKDGVLSDSEKLAAAEAMKNSGMLPGSGLVPGSEEFLKKFDRDGDGKLSAAEKLAAQSAWQKMRAGGGGGPATGALPGGGLGGGLPAGLNAPGDTDKPTKKVNPLIKLYDKDGDGKLNDEEKAALQADRNKKKKAKKEDKP